MVPINLISRRLSPKQRIIDHIPLTIEHSLHHALAKQLSQSLFTSLLTDPERMNELVSEDASIAERRKTLTMREKRLSDIRRRLMNFSNST